MMLYPLLLYHVKELVSPDNLCNVRQMFFRF